MAIVVVVCAKICGKMCGNLFLFLSEQNLVLY